MKRHGLNLVLLASMLTLSISSVSPKAAAAPAADFTDNVIDQTMSLSNITGADDLQAELQLLVQHLVADPNDYGGIGYSFTKSNPTILYMRGSMVSTLAMVLPLLPGPVSDGNSLQGQLAARLKSNVTGYLLNSQYWDWEFSTSNVPTATYVQPANPNISLNWWHRWNGGPYWEKLHALWAYAYYTGDWTTISNNWSSFIRSRCLNGDVDPTHQRAVMIAAREAVYREEVNDLANGLLGCVRMSTHISGSTNADTVTLRTRARAALSAVISQLNVSWTASPVSDGSADNAQAYTTVTGDWAPGYNLTPEIGRWINSQAMATAQTRLDEAANSGPLDGHWFAGYLNNTERGAMTSLFYDEDYWGMPNLSHELFLGRAWMLQESGDVLRQVKPWHVVMGRVPEYRDMLYLRSLYALISRYATVTWVTAN
jgi:hypothetical protein